MFHQGKKPYKRKTAAYICGKELQLSSCKFKIYKNIYTFNTIQIVTIISTISMQFGRKKRKSKR